MFNIKFYTESELAALYGNHVFSFAVGSVIKSRKTGMLWHVTHVNPCSMRMIKRGENGERVKLYAPVLNVQCQDGTVTDMYDQLMAENFDLFDVDAVKVDKKTFRAIRALVGQNSGVSGKLADIARTCYRIKKDEKNMYFYAVSQRHSDRLICEKSDIDFKNRTVNFGRRSIPLFGAY